MKKHFVLFFVYCAVIVTGLSLFLIFYKNTEETTPTVPDEYTYATKFSVNCARTIEMQNNSSIEFVNGYVNVEPSEASKHLKVTIESTVGHNNGLTFSNNVVTATKLGQYKLKFEILSSKTKTLNDTIIINVVNTYEGQVSPLLSSTIVGKTYSLEEVLNISNAATNFTIVTDSLTTYSNNIFSFNHVGVSKIEIEYTSNFIKRKFSHNIIINPTPEYDIKIISPTVENGIIETNCLIGESFYLQYEVTNNNQDYVNQSITIETDNSIIEYLVTEPLIKITCKAHGYCDFKITSDIDTSVYIIIQIKFN